MSTKNDDLATSNTRQCQRSFRGLYLAFGNYSHFAFIVGGFDGSISLAEQLGPTLKLE
jgi:hypothetical protein